LFNFSPPPQHDKGQKWMCNIIMIYRGGRSSSPSSVLDERRHSRKRRERNMMGWTHFSMLCLSVYQIIIHCYTCLSCMNLLHRVVFVTRIDNFCDLPKEGTKKDEGVTSPSHVTTLANGLSSCNETEPEVSAFPFSVVACCTFISHTGIQIVSFSFLFIEGGCCLLVTTACLPPAHNRRKLR